MSQETERVGRSSAGESEDGRLQRAEEELGRSPTSASSLLLPPFLLFCLPSRLSGPFLA